MIETKAFYDYLINSNIDFFAGVPDSLLANLCACIKENSSCFNNVITANEGNAVAMCAGYYLSTGKIGLVYMQNSGEGNTINPLLSLVDEDVYSIPMLLVIGWRGEPGKHDEPQHVKQGKVTLSLLDAIGMKYSILSDNYQDDLEKAISYMEKNKKPYALIIQKGIFSGYKTEKEKSEYQLTREDALKSIINCLNEEDIIVSTTGKTSREIFEIREQNHQGHSNDFLTVGSMGHTASIAYGISLGSNKEIYCIDGDGSFIMHMGSLAVIGSKLTKNFKYIINVNNAHESVGGQPTCAKNLDIVKILMACGFKKVITAKTEKEITLAMKELKENSKVALVLYTKQGSREDLGRPTTTPIENKEALMKNLGVK